MPPESSLHARKGAVRISDIAPEVLYALNTGAIPTVNLVEFLAIDLTILARSVAQYLGLPPGLERLEDTLAMLPAIKPMQRHGYISRAFYDIVALRLDRDTLADKLARHPSDIARGWAAFWVSCADLSLADKLNSVRRFAADGHFGVREMAWSAVRNDVIGDLSQALDLLTSWTLESDAYLRRFACELTRPRGVWCAQIEALKAQPWLAQGLLEPLKADPSRYVQNSVANWLNDASKTQSHWVAITCDQWLKESDSSATRYIVNRALRSLRKLPID